MSKFFDSGFTVEDFHKGQRVRYISDYRDPRAPQYGVVSSTNNRNVFVKFDNAEMRMVTGDEPYTAQACSPCDLVFQDNKEEPK